MAAVCWRSTGRMSVKAVRTDAEIECPGIDAGLRARGVELVTLPDGVSEDALCLAVADADLLLMCYAPSLPALLRSSSLLLSNPCHGHYRFGMIRAIFDRAARRVERRPAMLAFKPGNG